jgi:hypothetical protein
LIDMFDRELVETQEAVGMDVLHCATAHIATLGHLPTGRLV